MTNPDQQIPIPHLPNDILALVFDYIRKPTDWDALMRTNQLCRSLVERICFPHIATIHIRASSTIDPEFHDRPGLLWIEAAVSGPCIEPPHRSNPTIKGPRKEYKFCSISEMKTFSLADRLERFIMITLPYLWFHTRSDIEISLQSDETKTFCNTPVAEDCPLKTVFAALLRLQKQHPKTVTGFHLETRVNIPPHWIAYFLTDWKQSLRKVSLFSDGYHLPEWVPLLQQCPLTHLGINLGPHREQLKEDMSQEVDIPFNELGPLFQTPLSQISHLTLRFCELPTHKHQTDSNEIQLAKLLLSLRPTQELSLSLPPQHSQPDNFEYGFEQQNNWLAKALAKVPSLPNNPRMPSPLMQIELRKLILIDRSKITMQLDSQFITTFPLLAEIEGIAMTPGLIDEVAVMVGYHIYNHKPLQLVITCPPIHYAEDRYRHTLISATYCTRYAGRGIIVIKTPETFLGNEDLSIRFRNKSPTVDVLITATVLMIN
jgi:hypothetical protein